MASGSSERPRVLVVDDSPFIRRVVADLVRDGAGFDVAGEAVDGIEAIQMVHALDPDIVTLDLEMPGLGGLEALGYIMSESPRPVVVLTGRDGDGAVDLTMRALELGAVDFVRKPSWDATIDVETLRHRLVQALQASVQGRVTPPRRPPPRPWRASLPRSVMANPHVPARGVCVIAASTGGPRALADLVPALPAVPGVGWLVVQHMPAHFTPGFTKRLADLAGLPVVEVVDGMALEAAVVHVAPGGRHVLIDGAPGQARLRLSDAPPEHGVRPAADVSLRAAAQVFGVAATAVVLTGMGRDGAAGALSIRQAGGVVVVQDPVTCVVAGMPHAALQVVKADAVVSLDELPVTLANLCAPSRPALSRSEPRGAGTP